MRCPECNKFPFRLLKIRLFGGVGVKNYLKGFIKCIECGAILKVLGYDRSFWYIFPAYLVLVQGIIFLLQWILEDRLSFIWIFIILALMIGFGVGNIVKRYTRVEKGNLESDLYKEDDKIEGTH
jgi:hypothetical protein